MCDSRSEDKVVTHLLVVEFRDLMSKHTKAHTHNKRKLESEILKFHFCFQTGFLTIPVNNTILVNDMTIPVNGVTIPVNNMTIPIDEMTICIS